MTVSDICRKNVLNQEIGQESHADTVVKTVCLQQGLLSQSMLIIAGHGSEKMCDPEKKAAFAAA